ncbi:MAG: NADH-quinone oxidoreductase subunit G [Phycisphaerales bacterium]|jgi:NADH-quinone oxidoreductase subunit G
MPTITIDGKLMEFEQGQSILDVASENEIEIPQYCYHPSLSVVASCRICLAEVWGPNPRNNNKLEPMPKLLPTCQTPAGDGQVVYTTSPKATANQKSVMELLLNHHPIDCPTCDQAGECSLQDYAYEYGRGERRCDTEKITQSKKDVGDNIMLYGDRCIMCTRCVRFAEEVTGTAELYISGRGVKEEIDVFPGMGINNELSGNVIDLCPVGALLDKDFMFQQRVWLLKTTPSIDPLTSSGDNINIEHNNNKVYRVKPRTNLDVNQYWITDEVRYGWKFIHDEFRVVTSGDDTELLAADILQKTTRLALLVSPMITCEDAWLLGKLVRSIDTNAIIGIGPIPIVDEDKTFPSGFTIRSEKAPNARGVRRALGDALAYDEWKTKIAAADTVVVTGNYPEEWDTPTITDEQKLILIDTLQNELTVRADVFLPAATWAEKAGTFENHSNKLQLFEQALQPIGDAQAEGQIAMNLKALVDDMETTTFNAATVRLRMADAGISGMLEVELPKNTNRVDTDMPLSEI